MAILSADDYPEIRAAIDVELTDQDLADEVISMGIYKDAADQDVINLDPDAESRTGANADRIKRAAILFCAARLVPVVVRLTSVTVQARDLSYQRALYDPVKRASELRALAAAEIEEVLAPTDTSPNRPTMFVAADGTRGR